jgi:hypothetical protein
MLCWHGVIGWTTTTILLLIVELTLSCFFFLGLLQPVVLELKVVH